MRPNARAFLYLLFTLEVCIVIGFALYLGALTPPVPSRREATTEKIQATAQIDQQPSQKPAAPNPSDADLVIDISTKQPDEKASQYNWDAIGVLAAIVLGALQIWILINQNRIASSQAQIAQDQKAIIETQTTHMADGLKIAQASANAAKASAEAALIGASEAKKTSELARADLIYTHRPKVIVRNLDIRNLMDGYVGNSIDGFVWLTNTGFTTANVLRIHTEWYVGQHLPMRNPVITARPQRINKLLFPGRSTQLSITPLRDVTFDVHMAAYGDATNPENSLYLLGIVKYWDELRNMRRTVFCRRWNVSTKRFEIVDDADFESAD